MPSTVSGVALLNRLVYLDRAYVSDLYEVVTGESPGTQITRSQAKRAGAAVPVFSAEVSAQETRSYPLSTFAMLQTVLPDLKENPDLDPALFEAEMSSRYGWIEGELTVFKVQSTVRESRTGEQKTLASDAFFQIRTRKCEDLALITTPEYFASGLDNFIRMQDTLLKEMSIPVRAYMRVMSANSHHGQWVVVPLVILERE